jgi:hypothetical protein
MNNIILYGQSQKILCDCYYINDPDSPNNLINALKN